MVIYKYTNKINNKVYIGMTIRNLEVRHNEHSAQDIDDGTAFHNAIKKYGIQNFKLETIDTATTIEELQEKEIMWIKHYNSYVHAENSNGYNITLGGGGMSGYGGYWKGKHRDKETREKISRGRIGKYGGEKSYWFGKGHLMSGPNNPNYGKPLSQKQKDEHSAFMKGRYSGKNNPNARMIICITTGEYFDHIKQASEKYGINKADISACCKGKLKSAGKRPITREKMVWKYQPQQLALTFK